MEGKMTAYNVVRFRVKPGQEKAFIDAHKKMDREFSGMRKFTLVKTGDHAFCVIGEWESIDNLVAARPNMIGILDTFRHMLEDMGNDMGVTDPVSGSAVLEHV